MSCPNFQSMLYGMPMICGRTFAQMSEQYKAECGEDMPESEYEFMEQDDINYAEELAEEFNRDLQFHDITVIGGHYVSYQFYVEEKYSRQFDMDKSSDYCIDNEDAHYYFDMCRSRALRAADAEKRKIVKWLHGLTKYGYNETVRTALFSNGEAEYSIVTPRTKLIAAARA